MLMMGKFLMESSQGITGRFASRKAQKQVLLQHRAVILYLLMEIPQRIHNPQVTELRSSLGLILKEIKLKQTTSPWPSILGQEAKF